MLTLVRFSVATLLVFLSAAALNTAAWPGPVLELDPIAPAAVPETLQPIPPIRIPDPSHPSADSPAIRATDPFAGMTTTGTGAATAADSDAQPTEPSRTGTTVDVSDVQLMCDQNALPGARNTASGRLRGALKRNLPALRGYGFAEEDVVQDTIASILQKCIDILTQPNPPAYIHVMLKNRIIDLYRQQKSLVSLDDDEAAYGLLQFDLPWSLATPTAGFETADLVQRLESELSPREKQVLVRLLAEQETADVAAELNISQDRVREIRQQIRDKYQAFMAASNN